MTKYQKNGPPLRTIALKIKGYKETTVGCSCTKTKCMNFFCSCFSASSSCIEGCNCEGCNNTEGYRKMAMSIDFETFCNCSRSNCVKKYCYCFKSGQQCSKACGCINCENLSTYHPTPPEQLNASTENINEDVDMLALVIEQIEKETNNRQMLDESFEKLREEDNHVER